MKQKFFEVYNRYYKRSDKLDRMVELADDYAIDFAEWIDSNHKSISLAIYSDKKKVLQIFKKEKGL